LGGAGEASGEGSGDDFASERSAGEGARRLEVGRLRSGWLAAFVVWLVENNSVGLAFDDDANREVGGRSEIRSLRTHSSIARTSKG
jgi:hypothetical protein